MIKLDHACQEVYDKLHSEFSDKTFTNGERTMTFDEFFKDRFDFAPYPNNPGYGTVDANSLEHASDYCWDHIVE